MSHVSGESFFTTWHFHINACFCALHHWLCSKIGLQTMRFVKRFYICCCEHPVSGRSFAGKILHCTASDAFHAPSSSNGTLFGNKYRKNWALTMEGNSQHCRSFKETQQKSHFQNMVWMTSDPGKYSGKKTPQFERLVAKMWAKDERKTRFLQIATWKRTLSRLKRI